MRRKFIGVLLVITIVVGFYVTGNNGLKVEAYENEKTVDSVDDLVTAVKEANTSSGGYRIILEPGTYLLNQFLYITNDYMTIESSTGDYKDVVIEGKGMYGNVSHIFLITSSHVTIKNISMGEVANHLIQVQGEKGASNFSVIGCRFYNSYEQMLKVSKGDGSNNSKNGLVEDCLFEYTAGIGPQYYIGGIDVHKGVDWTVRGCTFNDIISPESALAEHAIHFWSESENTIVENNVIIDCDRGIGFGLGSSGHQGGIIRNNYVYSSRDVGIGLENASGDVLVTGNVVYTPNYMNAIEYRFEGTSAIISDNVTSATVAKRNGGSGELADNSLISSGEWSVSGWGNEQWSKEITLYVPAGIELDSVLVSDKAITNGEDVTGIDEIETAAGADEIDNIPSEWAKEGVLWVKEEDVVKEELFTKYQDDITRADFTYLATILYGELIDESFTVFKEEDVFSDTDDPWVLKAYDLGIVGGYGDGRFGPDDKITREQVGAILMRTMRLAGVELDESGLSSISFKDIEDISSWALEDIRLANKYGIVNGVGDNRIAPKENATREQSLLLVYNILRFRRKV